MEITLNSLNNKFGNDAELLESLTSRSALESCRETLKINHEEQAFHHYLTLGIQEKLRKRNCFAIVNSLMILACTNFLKF